MDNEFNRFMTQGRTSSSLAELEKKYGLEDLEIPRIRAAWEENAGTRLYVRARLGGNNEDLYAEELDEIEGHPQYHKTIVDKYDLTYVTFVFNLPERDEQ